MASRLIYLEVDDEITSAAARIRAAEQDRLAVVLPHGSRVATSRINFRLLSRDATEHDKRLSIVSADPATRALAASAGLPVFASVAEYEAVAAQSWDAATARAREPPVVVAPVARAGRVDSRRRRTGRSAWPRRCRGRRRDAGPAPSAPLSRASHAGARATPRHDRVGVAPVRPARPVRHDHERPRQRSHPHALAHRGGDPGSGAACRWRRCIRAAALGDDRRHAAAGADHPDPPDGRRRPERRCRRAAIRRSSRPEQSRSRSRSTTPFPATGKRVELTKATGTVRFENLDPTSTNRIPSGSIVSTAAGIRFRTLVTITVPRAELVGLTIFPARASVKITAVEGGPDGNVDAGTIVDRAEGRGARSSSRSPTRTRRRAAAATSSRG